MTQPDDYYALLRVSPEADGGVIRLAYRALMRRYHPDVNASGDAAAQARAINEAYACLRDARRRATYDRERMQPSTRPFVAAAQASPRRPQSPRPAWTGPAPPVEAHTRWFRPTLGNAIGLGIAAVITAITFTITSTIPPVAPAVAGPVMVAKMKIAPTAKIKDTQCKSASVDRPPAAACLP